jgi:hypothetical protein
MAVYFSSANFTHLNNILKAKFETEYGTQELETYVHHIS